MDKINNTNTKVTDSSISDGESQSLRAANPEDARRFDSILFKKDNKENGKNHGEQGLEDSLETGMGLYERDISKIKNNTKSKHIHENWQPVRNDETKKMPFSGEVGTKFAELKSKKHEEERDAEQDEKIIPNQGAGTGINPGDAILGSLPNTSTFYNTDVNKVVDTQTKTIQTIGVEIAERIIASHEALNAKQEVRISLKDNILSQTEVRIFKDDATGVLGVGFCTSSDRSAALLYAKQTGLRAYLLQNLKDVSDVEVSVYQDSVNNEQHDGRSKQEYVGDYNDTTDEE